MPEGGVAAGVRTIHVPDGDRGRVDRFVCEVDDQGGAGFGERGAQSIDRVGTRRQRIAVVHLGIGQHARRDLLAAS